MDKEKEEEFLRLARAKLEGIDATQVEELIKRIEEGRAGESDREQMKRLFRWLGWMYQNLAETSGEEHQ